MNSISFKDFLLLHEDTHDSYATYGGESILSWPSSFSEIRNINEDGQSTGKASINESQFSKPKFTPAEARAVYRYTAASSENQNGFASSKNMNYYLRNRGRTTNSTTLSVKYHPVSKVHQAVQELSAAFKPEYLNKKPMMVFSGIPAHIGKKLMDAGQNSHHVLAGFTSTTTDPVIAEGFASRTVQDTPDRHVLKIKLEPGAGLPIMNHSHFEHEKEILLHHGAHITYHGTEAIPRKDRTDYIHHITVHATHKPLSEYGDYKPIAEDPSEDHSKLNKGDPSMDEQHMHVLKHGSNEDITAMLKSPHVTSHVLHHIVANMPHLPAITRRALMHPNADESVITAGLAHPNESIRDQTASHPKLKGEALHNYIHSNIRNLDRVLPTIQNSNLTPQDAHAIYNQHKFNPHFDPADQEDLRAKL